MSKRELVLSAIRGEAVERIPVGFWLHYVTQEEKELGLDNPAVVEKSIKGHQEYVEKISPDFVKIMSDGFFRYPSALYSREITSIQELKDIQPIGEHHPWIEQQIEVVKEIRSHFHEEIASFYNIFSPISYLKRWFRTDQSRGDQVIADFLKEDPETLAHVLDVIAGDIAILSRRLIQEAGVEGIYFSTQQVQDERVTEEEYRKFIEPSNIAVLEAANEAGGINILHICGFEGASNEVDLFKDYPAQVINWATHHEGLSLAAGRKLFGDRAVLGGFVNGKNGLLYQGARRFPIGTLRLGTPGSRLVRRKEREMKKIHVWCIVMTVLFLVLGLAKATAASTQDKAKQDPDKARLEKIPAHSLSLIRPSDVAGILLLDGQ